MGCKINTYIDEKTKKKVPHWLNHESFKLEQHLDYPKSSLEVFFEDPSQLGCDPQE